MSYRRTYVLFITGALAGLAALGFNFLLRVGGYVAYPPESVLMAFLRVIPASIEEPMVQQLGDLADQLGILVATLIGAAVYGLIVVLFDRLAARRLTRIRLSNTEFLFVLGLVPWLLFGLLVLPIDGDYYFGTASVYAAANSAWMFPFTLLLVQCLFAVVLSLRYRVIGPMEYSALPQKLRQDLERRTFIEKGSIGVAAVIAGFFSIGSLSQLFASQAPSLGGSQPIDLQDAPAIFRDHRLSALVDSEVTPNGNFYRVAIDLIDPTVDLSTWSLMVDGLVNTPKTYSLQDLQSFPEADQYTTFECVSNNVNGNLIGNAKWGGVKISDLLANAGGVQPSAQYVVFYSVDGYSVGIPLAKAMMQDSIVAFSMNGQPLPTKHGYPLRGVIPGLYGMMSAKWVTRITVMPSVYVGYWQTRGWTNAATIYTEAFIAIPGPGIISLSQSGGSIVVAGYAFAGDRGISKVEVSVDNGATWQEAQLKQPISNLTWSLWAYDWHPQGAGEYKVIVRATDGTGEVQTSAVADTFPNGATGYAGTIVNVSN